MDKTVELRTGLGGVTVAWDNGRLDRVRLGTFEPDGERNRLCLVSGTVPDADAHGLVSAILDYFSGAPVTFAWQPTYGGPRRGFPMERREATVGSQKGSAEAGALERWEQRWGRIRSIWSCPATESWPHQTPWPALRAGWNGRQCF